MQVDLTLEELEMITDALWGTARCGKDEALAIRFQELKEQAEELEELDLGDCASGACKL